MQTKFNLRLPPRPVEGHKGLFGKVLVVGGNDEMIGEAVFAGCSALRMGAGLVQIAMPRQVLAAALSICPELIGLALGSADDESRLLRAAASADAIVIGPGLGQSKPAASWLKKLMKLDKPMVIDADGLNLLASQGKWPADVKCRAVLTPHPGEMKRLMELLDVDMDELSDSESSRLRIAKLASKTFGKVVLLKGHRTLVTDGDRHHVNQTGDSTLSKAGTGDVLAGIIGCLLAQQVEPYASACIGAHLHGVAGELAGKTLGRRSALARDVIDHIPSAIRKMEGKRFC